MANKTVPEPTMSDVILSINGLRTQFTDMQAQIDGLRSQISGLATKDELDRAVAGLATKDELDSAVAGLATKDELQGAVANLEQTVKHEAGDLGESIASLASMVDGRFNGVNVRLDSLETAGGPRWRKYIL